MEKRREENLLKRIPFKDVDIFILGQFRRHFVPKDHLKLNRPYYFLYIVPIFKDHICQLDEPNLDQDPLKGTLAPIYIIVIFLLNMFLFCIAKIHLFDTFNQ